MFGLATSMSLGQGLFEQGGGSPNDDLKSAVQACLQEQARGNCKCSSGCGGFSGPIGTWDTSKVTDMTLLFRTASIFNQDISSWDTSRVRSLGGM